MMQATVNGESSYSVEVTPGGIMINDQLYPEDIHPYGERFFHSVHRQAGYTIELLEADYQRKSFVFKMERKIVRVDLKNELDVLVEKMGMAQLDEATVKDIAAPMPGLIVGISVKEGQAISQGSSVLTLEAMKMENVIKSPVDGTISTVHVKAGDSVDKDQVLVSFQELNE